MGCCDVLSKIILILFSILFVLIGGVPLAFGIIALVDEELLNDIITKIPGTENISAIIDLNTLIANSAIFLLTVGSCIVALGIFGVCGSCCKALKCTLYLFINLMVLVILAEIALIVVMTEFSGDVVSYVETEMKKTLPSVNDCRVTATGEIYCFNDEMSVAWNTLQYELRCCGGTGYKDYQNVNWTNTRDGQVLAPLTCCVQSASDADYPPKPSDNVPCYDYSTDPDDYYHTSCYDAFMKELLSNPIVIGVLVGIGVLEIALISLTINLVCQNKRKEKV